MGTESGRRESDNSGSHNTQQVVPLRVSDGNTAIVWTNAVCSARTLAAASLVCAVVCLRTASFMLALLSCHAAAMPPSDALMLQPRLLVKLQSAASGDTSTIGCSHARGVTASFWACSWTAVLEPPGFCSPSSLGASALAHAVSRCVKVDASALGGACILAEEFECGPREVGVARESRNLNSLRAPRSFAVRARCFSSSSFAAAHS